MCACSQNLNIFQKFLSNLSRHKREYAISSHKLLWYSSNSKDNMLFPHKSLWHSSLSKQNMQSSPHKSLWHSSNSKQNMQSSPHKSLWHSSNSKQNMLPPHRSANGFYINRYNSGHCYSIDIWDHCVCNDFVLHEEMYECVSI